MFAGNSLIFLHFLLIFVGLITNSGPDLIVFNIWAKRFLLTSIGLWFGTTNMLHLTRNLSHGSSKRQFLPYLCLCFPYLIARRLGTTWQPQQRGNKENTDDCSKWVHKCRYYLATMVLDNLKLHEGRQQEVPAGALKSCGYLRYHQMHT